MRSTLYYTVEARDKHGKLLKREKRRSRSFVQQWNELVCVQAGQKANLSIKDTGGADRDVDYFSNTLDMKAAVNLDSFGPVVGTGNTAVTIADYALGAQCSHGTGEDEFEHLATTVGDPSVAGSDCSFTITRQFLNNSGSAITVKEIGSYTSGYDGAAPRYFLGIRDVLVTPLEIPDGGAITLTYTIKVTV